MASFKSWGQVKATADLFETIIAVYFNEKGFEALCDWVAPMYTPLIRAGKRAYMSKYAILMTFFFYFELQFTVL